ncbi:MAG: head GIN domain-containing protein [Salibacteraceae bacterium]
MKTSNAILGIFSIAVLFFSSCDKNKCVEGSGGNETRTIRLANFNQLELAESADVYISQGADQQITVTAPANIIDILNRDVSGSRWVIDFDNHCAKDYKMIVNIVVPNINELVISGAGDIIMDDMIGGETLSLNISGSGNISFKQLVSTKNLNSIISGSGDIYAGTLNSDIQNMDLKISGSGNYRGFNVHSANSDILISGSGNVETTTNSNLDVNITGSGNVYYKGFPNINSNISGSGNVINRN